MINPRAYLTSVKNVRKGLEARSKIITVLEGGECSAIEISRKTGLPLHVVRHHLKRLKRDRVVEKRGRGRGVRWRLTGAGQASIEEAVG